MEKSRPHYELEEVRTKLNEGLFMVTQTARRTAAYDFDFSEKDIVKGVAALSQREFYKSMTCYERTSLWQDVYRPTYHGTPAYVKLGVVDGEVIIISFKKR